MVSAGWDDGDKGEGELGGELPPPPLREEGALSCSMNKEIKAQRGWEGVGRRCSGSDGVPEP